MHNNIQGGSRSSYRAKRKKTNIILNSLIIIVLLLITIVVYSIFSTDNSNASLKKEGQNAAAKSSVHTMNKEPKSEKTGMAKSKSENNSKNDSRSIEKKKDDQEKSETVTTEEDSSSDGAQTIVIPDWEPVGTTQTGTHTTVYDDSSKDWQEMIKAISYATGLDQSKMTIWRLERDRNISNGSIGTVSSKDEQQKYRVYIQWVDGEGWQPTKVEKLTE